MAKTPTPQNPLILRCHRLMDTFAKSDDERDFYLDRVEGFILQVDLDKSQDELDALQKELNATPERFCPIPKMSFYESKKIMEGFVNDKVYDIDTKEKLLDITQAKGAREHFLEFLYDHHAELEKWHQFYQERARIRIIEWLRDEKFDFVFEEDIDLSPQLVEKLKLNTFESKVSRDISTARKTLQTKAATYYSNEALNPRPKRGRPPKQAQKVEVDTQFTGDFYKTVSPAMKPFVYAPDINSIQEVTFSSKFQSQRELVEHMKGRGEENITKLDELSKKLASLQSLSEQYRNL